MSIGNVDEFEREFYDEVHTHNLDAELVYKSEIQLSSIWSTAVGVIKFLPYLFFLLGSLKSGSSNVQ